MAKINNLPASAYAKPHTMSGKPVNVVSAQKQMYGGRDPNTMSANEVTPKTPRMRVSMGNPAADDVKTDGIKIRGTGAATKGLYARGPMA